MSPLTDPVEIRLRAETNTQPVPGVWAATMAYDQWCWLNQENGWSEHAPRAVTDWDDVQKLIMEVMER